MSPEFNDGLDELFGGPAVEPAAPRATPPQWAVEAEERAYFEPCRKCRGTGSYGNFGVCYACQGKKGKTFKTPPAQRAQARAKAQERKENGADQNWEAFAKSAPATAAWITAKMASFGFASAMHDAVRRFGGLTDRQEATCARLMAADAERAAQRQQKAATAPEVDVSRIEQAFAKAKASGLKYPKLRLAGFVVSPAGAASKNAGSLYVKSDNDTYLGKVTSGRFFAARECDDETRARVIEAASDPDRAAVAYGKETGTCSCCGLELTDPVSIAKGVGPICWKRYFA
jgi:Family of unknown function (DUF6011)